MITTGPRRGKRRPAIYGGRAVTIQGVRFHISLARERFICLQCLEGLKEVDHGLKCKNNNQHYGLISKKQAEAMTRREIMIAMADLFPNLSKHKIIRGGIDLVDGPQIWTIKDIKSVERKKFQSTQKEVIALISFVESNLTVRIPVSVGRLLFAAFGVPDKWKGQLVKVYDNEEQKPGEKKGVMHVVTRLAPTGQKLTVNIGDMSKIELMAHCKKTLMVWYSPYEPKVLGRLMGCVLSQADLANGNFQPAKAYEEMSTIGVALHSFLMTFDDYAFALDWIIDQFSVSGLVYGPDDEPGIREAIQVASGLKTEQEALFDAIIAEVGYFQNHAQIEVGIDALKKMEITWGDPLALMTELGKWANEKADEQ